MSNPNKPPTAFESWYAREGLAYDPYAKRAMQVAWNASKREAVEEAAEICKQLSIAGGIPGEAYLKIKGLL